MGSNDLSGHPEPSRRWSRVLRPTWRRRAIFHWYRMILTSSCSTDWVWRFHFPAWSYSLYAVALGRYCLASRLLPSRCLGNSSSWKSRAARSAWWFHCWDIFRSWSWTIPWVFWRRPCAPTSFWWTHRDPGGMDKQTWSTLWASFRSRVTQMCPQ